MKLILAYMSAVFMVGAGVSLSNVSIPSLTFAREPQKISLIPLFPDPSLPSITFDQTIIASPLLDQSQGKTSIVVSASDGEIAVLDAETGAPEWKIKAPAPEGQQVELVSTPVTAGDKLIVVYQCLDRGVRVSHRLAVIDLTNKKLDEAFPVLELYAEKPG
ncbi:MAG: hypothetical protein ACXWUD_08810, partial [Methylosarcina sp.]